MAIALSSRRNIVRTPLVGGGAIQPKPETPEERMARLARERAAQQMPQPMIMPQNGMVSPLQVGQPMQPGLAPQPVPNPNIPPEFRLASIGGQAGPRPIPQPVPTLRPQPLQPRTDAVPAIPTPPAAPSPRTPELLGGAEAMQAGREGPPPPEFVQQPTAQLAVPGVDAQAIIDKLAKDVDEARAQVEYFDDLVAGAQQAIETATTPEDKARGRVALARAQRQQGIAESKRRAIESQAQTQQRRLATAKERQATTTARAKADFQAQQRLTTLRPVIERLKDTEQAAKALYQTGDAAAAQQAQDKIQRLIDAVEASRGRTVLPVELAQDADQVFQEGSVLLDPFTGNVYTSVGGELEIEEAPRIVFDGATGRWVVEIDGEWVYVQELSDVPLR